MTREFEQCTVDTSQSYKSKDFKTKKVRGLPWLENEPKSHSPDKTVTKNFPKSSASAIHEDQFAPFSLLGALELLANKEENRTNHPQVDCQKKRKPTNIALWSIPDNLGNK